MKIGVLLIVLSLRLVSNAQSVQGYVIEELSDGKKNAVAGAIISVLASTKATVTDSLGYFKLEKVNAATDALVISAVGYKTDTLQLKGKSLVTVSLQPLVLGQVEVTGRKATRLDASPMNVEVLNSGDLVKDACCNLSESFENSAAVDVSYSDAVSGAKEIRMLGLDGVYTQIMWENVPSIRSLGNTFGLNYVPGPWMSSIQVNKGAGSVVNGYESMTGQINLEYKKPANSEKLHVNLFLNQDLRSELNIISAQKINAKSSALTAVNGSLNWFRMDQNKDGYLDNPLVKNINVLQRYTYLSGKAFSLWSGVAVNLEDRIGGSVHFNPSLSLAEQNYWGLRLTTERVEAFAKTGFNLSNDNFVGLQYKYLFHHQEGYIGRRSYSGNEHFGYFNSILQHNVGDEITLKAGISVQLDNVREQFDTFNRNRLEVVPGVFTEGTFNFGKNDKVTMVVGGRVDYHSMYGPFLTPRFNLKWNIVHDFSMRVSAGRGYRVPTIFAENFGWLSNNRAISIAPDLKYEEAWNYGANLTYKFFLGYREGVINVDYYRTDFVNQVVVDMEDVRKLQFYNLAGQSFANAVQADVNYEVIKGFDVKLAYKFEQNKTDYHGALKIYPLRPQHRGLVSLQYTTKNKMWRFNTSMNWFGKTRIPDTSVNDAPNQRDTQSKDWFQLNAQITFKWKAWEVYVGGENLLNFTQPNPIIAGNQPFGNQFDASLVWGPLRGAMAFAGFRFVIK
jgi:outer membrane receptor for ferrienterochelin and colicins